MASVSRDSDPAGEEPVTSPSRRAVGRVLVVGVLAGLASGLFGVGGGVVIVPGLVMLAAYQQRLAHGTSLAAIVPIATVATIGYATAGEVDFAVGLLIALGAMAGTPLGVAALARMPQRWLQLGFAAVLALTAVRLVVEPGSGVGRGALDVAGAAGYLVTGVGLGALAGLMGVGGGVVLVPLLTIVFGFPLVLAKGTSLAAIVPISVLGTMRNVRQGTTDLKAGMVLGLGGVVTAAVASQVSLGLDQTTSAWSFAALLALVTVRMVRRVSARDPG